MENGSQENIIENTHPLTVPKEIEQVNNQKNENNKGKRNHKKYLFIILGIIIILIIGITLYFTVFKDDKVSFNPNNSETTKVDKILKAIDESSKINYVNEFSREVNYKNGKVNNQEFKIYYNAQKNKIMELSSDCSFINSNFNPENRNEKFNLDELYRKEEGMALSEILTSNVQQIEFKDNHYYIHLIDNSLLLNALQLEFKNLQISDATYIIGLNENKLFSVEIDIPTNSDFEINSIKLKNNYTYYENEEPEELEHMKSCVINLEKIQNTVLENSFQLQANGKTINVKIEYDPYYQPSCDYFYYQDSKVYFDGKLIDTVTNNGVDDFYLNSYHDFTENDLTAKTEPTNFEKVTISGTEYFIYKTYEDGCNGSYPITLLLNDKGEVLKDFSTTSYYEEFYAFKKDGNGCYILGYDCEEPTFIKYNEDSIQYIEINHDESQESKYQILEKKLTITNGIINETTIKEYNFDDVVEEYYW